VFRASGLVRENYSAVRDALGARMSAEQLAEAKRLAAEWKAKWAH